MVELDIRRVGDLAPSRGYFEAKIAVLVITDHVIFGEASDTLENRAGRNEASSCDSRNDPFLACRCIIPGHAFMKMLVEPAITMVTAEIHASMLDRPVLEEELGSDGSNALTAVKPC